MSDAPAQLIDRAEFDRFIADRLASDGLVVLGRIPAGKGAQTCRKFTDVDAARTWAEKWNPEHGIYIVNNAPNSEWEPENASDTRDGGDPPDHADITLRRRYQIDGDPIIKEERDPEVLARVRAEGLRLIELFETEFGAAAGSLPVDSRPPGVIRAQLVVDSGRGVHFHFELKPHGIAGAITTGVNERIVEWFRSRANPDLIKFDGVANVARVMRCPGTTNPRTGAIVHVLRREPDSTASPSLWMDVLPPKDGPQFGAPTPKGTKPAAVVIDTTKAKRLADVAELGDKVSNSVKVYIVKGCNPDEPNHFPSRSEMLHWVTLELVRAGVAPETIYSVLTDPEFKVSESVIEKGRGAERYALRQIERAQAIVESEGADFQEHEGKRLPNQHNARVFLHREGVSVRFDEFADKVLIDGLPEFGPHFDDKASTRLRLLARSKYQLFIGREDWADFLTDLSLYHRFHPVREYLDSLSWDGKPRLDRWLPTYGMADDSEYARAVGALVLIAAVRRIMEPGCKFDEMLVLEGLQGKNKSSALATLAVREEWFSDDLPLDADTKRFIEAIAGKWIIEAGELKGMRKGEVDALKSTLSRRVDRARLAYGRQPVELPRQCIIIGSTNSEHYLKDATGNRRFWPVRCGEFDVEGLRRDRDQLWAEARAREARGESIRLAPRLYPDAGREQDARRVTDPFEEALEVHLAERAGKLRAHDVWTIIGKADVGRRTQEDMNRLGEVMRRLGWERTKRRFGGDGPEWCYVRGSKTEREQCLFVFTNEAGEVRSVGATPEYEEGGDE